MRAISGRDRAAGLIKRNPMHIRREVWRCSIFKNCLRPKPSSCSSPAESAAAASVGTSAS